MTQTRMNNVITLHVHKDALNLKAIADEFNARNQRRKVLISVVWFLN